MENPSNYRKGMLSGIRVLDFTRVLAGPLCTMLLGDLGAEVIKVESPMGDETRQWGPPWLGEGADRQSAYFLSVNRNKRSLVLDLKSTEGQNIARSLARQSHILVENFKPGQMAAFGLDYESLKAENPALVYASITGFGQTGPYRDRPGYDHVIQAMSGLMSITGPADGEPHKVGVAVSDVTTGLFALSGVLAALRSSEQTGQGQYLDFALLDSQIAGLVNIASSVLVSGIVPSRYGNRHPNIVPYQNFSASDGDFSVAVGNDGQFRALCRVIDHPELADDPRYATNPARVQNRESLVNTLQTIFWPRTADAWVDALLAEGIPAGPINTVSAALDDPHVAARGLVRETTLDSGETLRYVASPLMDTDAKMRYPPPALGQHSEYILNEMLLYGEVKLPDIESVPSEIPLTSLRLKVFISYSRYNSELMDDLVNELRRLGHDVWFDKELNNTGGQHWWDTICLAIRDCDLFVYALTLESLDSAPCKTEHTYAQTLNKNILPLMLSTFNINVIPASLGVLQVINYTNKDRHLYLRRSIENFPPPKPMPEPIPEPPPAPITELQRLAALIEGPIDKEDDQLLILVKLLDYLEQKKTQSEALYLLKKLDQKPSVLSRASKRIQRLLDEYDTAKKNAHDSSAG